MGQAINLASIRKILAYPHPTDREVKERLEEITDLGVLDLIPAGTSFIEDHRILGKGCTSVVVLAASSDGEAALKIQRTDSNRESCAHEAEILKMANNIGVGPKLLRHTKNLLLMEYIEGTKISSWLLEKTARHNRKAIVQVLRRVLEDCYSMDNAGIDHGQLNPARKHIIVRSNGTPVIIDFESSSIRRRVANVTSASQYLFIGSEVAENVCTALSLRRDTIKDSLRKYKRKTTRDNFQNLLRQCGMAMEVQTLSR